MTAAALVTNWLGVGLTVAIIAATILIVWAFHHLEQIEQRDGRR